jgi:hypothetical protein
MRSIIDSEEIAQRRQRAMRDVGEVLIFVDGVNAAGEVVHTNYVLSEGPGSDPIEVSWSFDIGGWGPMTCATRRLTSWRLSVRSSWKC